jgi:colanic acid/amylovoran biosynthesis glycosyltransferase
VPSALAVFLDRYPELSETFVTSELEALRRAGCHVRVEAEMRGNAAQGTVGGTPPSYRSDDRSAARMAGLVWLVLRHPLRCLEDLVARRRWRREEWPTPLRELAIVARRVARAGETHVHVHFAAAAALDAMRVARLLGLRWSVTAHAYEIFARSYNLSEKLERASFVTTGCRYNVEHLRGLVSPEAGARVHEIVMGVDPERFRRTRSLPGARTVVAVGRLVEKKGFRHLVEAAALLVDRGAVDRVIIVGEGPERDGLAALIGRLDLGNVVELAGARDPDEIRGLLEDADLLAAPCVITHDGDRDSMPVVIKEAMAMELVVVGTDIAGLPEAISPEWGRLVPPAAPQALAKAIEELLALSLEQRAAMGAAGRAWVIEHANVDTETAKLLALIASR